MTSPTWSFRTVLVPHDLSELSDAGLEAIRSLGTPVHQVHVVHVLPRVDPALPGLVWPREEDEARMEHARQALTTRLRGTDHESAIVHVRLGDPGSRVVQLANELGVDLIIVPSHSRHGLQRLVLGSIAEHVARFARCPVLILPAGALQAHHLPPHPHDPERDVPFDRDDQIDKLGAAITDRVQRTPGWLSALRIAIPSDEDAAWWEEALEKRLAESGIEFVDLVFTPRPTRSAEILDARFEENFAK